MLEERALWSTAPPEPRSRMANWPSLLFSWWTTSFAAVIIIIRLCGRKTRSNQLFREDWIMMISMIPMFIRMICVHFVLIYGTNNVQTVGYTFTERQLDHRSIGSRMVLAARIFYAMTIWLNKLTISEFLKRITIRIWKRSYERTLMGIRVFLFATFGAVVIATLGECHPHFDHYWQVLPDPGPHCRQGFAQLITMGTSDIITDLLLIAFPIPVVLNSGQSWKRKLQMGSLFSLSLIMIAVTATRMPMVISRHGRQQYRTVWASCEILASVGVSNAVILGSFLRDKGTKRNKYRAGSVTDSIERPSMRRPTLVTLEQTGSDEDLFRSLGFAIPEHLQEKTDNVARVAPPALPASNPQSQSPGLHRNVRNVSTIHDSRSSDSDDSLQKPPIEHSLPSPAPSTTKSASFFDVGGLLEDGVASVGSRSRSTTHAEPGVVAHDFAPPSPVQSRRGSNTFSYDVSGALCPPSREGRHHHSASRSSSEALLGQHSRPRAAPIGVRGPMLERQDTQMSLQDAGGLLRTPLDYQIDEDDSPVDAPLRPGTSSPRSRRTALLAFHNQRPAGSPDDLVLHDPGGLARR